MTNQEKLINAPEEAIECIKKNRPTSGYQMLNEALDLAIAALEKQEPKVPLEISWEYDCFKCPSCGKLITSTTGVETHKFCLKCGQALKFKEK